MPPSPPSHPPRSVLQILIIALLALAAATLTSIRVDAQEPPSRLAGSDLGVAPELVIADTPVLSPDGTSAGPAAVETYLDSLRGDYPEAEFDTTEVHVVGGLTIIDWQGAIDDTVVVHGRTLITVDDGRIVRLSFLDLNDVAPVEGGPSIMHQ